MNKELSVHSWTGSYYLSSERRWVCGKLMLTPASLRFTAEKGGETLVDFQLSSISEVKKEASSLIFSSLTVLEQGNVKHWFSSLQPNRNAVFNVLEHFWREQLLVRPAAEDLATPTAKGKQLIGLVSGSQRRAEDTAKVLHHQGEQFDSIIKGLDKIDSDMDVADRLLTELESPPWWPFSSRIWKGQQEAKPKDASSSFSSSSTTKAAGKEGLIVKIPVVYSQGADSNLKPGTLALLVSALEIGDSRSQLLHRYRREDVDDIKVHSPYKITIRQRFLGKPDISYHMLSARMPEAVAVLEVQYSKKIEFLEDAVGFRKLGSPAQSDMDNSFWNTASGFLEKVVHPALSDGGQCQVQVQQPTVSEVEAQELRQILTKLKCIALETETELDRQDEVLDTITSSTDRTTTQIHKHNRRMKKLM
ncbi:synaptosomal-associated protein 47 [Latimeria chalumnae]|uniref:synaptosomal-associated protein 47 n=1 Tax=Latimeria chalumnae TaxID=7897 RepID=UPI0006D9163F|nr:PREDICTED: synaptosomal-associated protein 47 [Latimeria chalumnae]|eukprot:XP_014340899.1 PREDICTED: synaptosomal-associated protein 47 [Latimeria chalumnae]